MKLELGSGQRPTPGYIHNDVTAFAGIDYVCSADQVNLPDSSLKEVLALGVIEHLTYHQAAAAFANVHRMLKPGGEFVFDVPDIGVWCAYLTAALAGAPGPMTLEHIFGTLYGWQRWPGDEHKSGWTMASIQAALEKAGLVIVETGVEAMLARGHHRNRFDHPEDAHLYIVARTAVLSSYGTGDDLA
jgi:predicted SAM-dependent methyltransferase